MNNSVSKFMPLIFIPFIIWAALELFLRFFIDVMPMNLQNMVLSNYNYSPDGIYFQDQKQGLINIMKPSIKRKMFYDGLRWTHQSNSIGIRDDRNIEKAEIVLLGDSMIYGHGVNNEHTLANYLEQISGLTVANLGVQGDYPPMQYLRLKHLGLFLQPKIVVFFINGTQDEKDFLLYKPACEYIDKIISEQNPDYSQKAGARKYTGAYKKDRYALYEHLCQLFFTARVARGLIIMTIKRFRLVKAFGEGKGIVKKGKNLYKDENSKSIYRIMKKILCDAKKLCNANNAEIIIAFHPDANKEKDSFNGICKQICDDAGLSFIDLNEYFPQQDYFFEKVGHYSPKGNKWAAQCVYGYLKTHNSL